MGNTQIKTEIKQEDGKNSQTLKDVLMAPSTTGNTPSTMSSAMTSSANSISTSTVFTPSSKSIDIKQEVKQEVEIKTEPDIKQEPNSEGGKQVRPSRLSSTYHLNIPNLFTYIHDFND